MAKTIMVQGTMSNVGKSLLVTALCRIFKQDGYRVAPFKALNVAPNLLITSDGLEIAKAQAVQAEAAGIEPDARMSAILLKPVSGRAGKNLQAVLFGKEINTISELNYYDLEAKLKPEILKAYNSLAGEVDVVVVEGSGSAAELNLDDFANMGIAKMIKAPVLLAGDIERGGIFAQLFGTVKILPKDENDLIKALVVNKFRGDISLFDGGVKILENICGKPVAGVVPYFDVDIEGEDALDAGKKGKGINLNVDALAAYRERNYDLLAQGVRNALDMRLIYNILNTGM